MTADYWESQSCPECEGTGVVSNCGTTVRCDGSHVVCDSRECPECDGEGQR